MSAHLQSQHFVSALYSLLDETFDNVHGIYLDRGTSMFETLSTISAQEASITVGGKCATLAAQVKHVAFYLDVLEQGVRTQRFVQQDWGKIWRETSVVTPDEWEALKLGLRQSYERIKALINDTTDWPSEQHIGGAIATIVHTAYHLGEIRQALCMIKDTAMQVEFVTKPAFSVVGMLLNTTPMSSEIPALWAQYGPRMGQLPHLAEPGASYGIMGKYDQATNRFDYLAGEPVTQVDDVPEGMSRWDVPANSYAVFKAFLPTLHQTMHEIYSTWLPSSGYQSAEGPGFEYYDKDFDPNDPASPLWVYMPVVRG